MNIQCDSKLSLWFQWPIIFKIGNTKLKLHKEYENVTQKVLLLTESILHNAKQLQRVQFYFIVSGLKIIAKGNPYNNITLYSDDYLVAFH
jgi:hypothetical protein